ncbi:MAG: hypothetical protein OXG67_03415 [bacterium]|nr:hypothetical protein [bacterium]
MPAVIPESIEERAFGPVELTEIAGERSESISTVEVDQAEAEGMFWWTSVVDCPTDTLANAVRLGFLTQEGGKEALAGLLGEYCGARVADLFVNRGAHVESEALLAPDGSWAGARVTVSGEVETSSSAVVRRTVVDISLGDVEWAAAATLVGAAAHVRERGSTPLDADLLDVVVPTLAQLGDFAGHAVFTPTEHDGLGSLCLAREILRRGHGQDSLHGLALLDDFLGKHAEDYCNGVGTRNLHQLRARLSWVYKETPDACELGRRLQTEFGDLFSGPPTPWSPFEVYGVTPREDGRATSIDVAWWDPSVEGCVSRGTAMLPSVDLVGASDKPS